MKGTLCGVVSVRNWKRKSNIYIGCEFNGSCHLKYVRLADLTRRVYLGDFKIGGGGDLEIAFLAFHQPYFAAR